MRLANSLIAITTSGVLHAVTAFTAPSTQCGRHSLGHSQHGHFVTISGASSFPVSRVCLHSKNGDSDAYLNENEYDDGDEEEEEDEGDGLEGLVGKKLGINLGAQLPSFTKEEIEDIRVQAQATLDKAIDGRLEEIEALREQMYDDLDKSRERLEVASKLNVQFAKQDLMEKIDRMSGDFLESTADFREETKMAAVADKMTGSMGRGVDWGSWGRVGGMDVILGSKESGDRPSKLLGSVDAARKKSKMMEEMKDMDFEDEVPVALEKENRVLVIVDEKQDKGSSQVMEKLAPLLVEAFDSDVIIDQYSPTSNVPIGGNNAQTALIFASALNDRSSLESLLGRILKRTLGGMPPSHVVVVSGLGTERTNKMPYSLQNLLGGKLDKLREIEQALVAVSRSRIEGTQPPLDYTIVKYGDVASSDGDSPSVSILPGDSLDGDIGPNAAANVLLQSMAFQPYARNATLCATGRIPEGAPLDEAVWNDKFLSLSGPELLRIEAGPGGEEVGNILDTKFEQLVQYVSEWSAKYEGSRKGTGLTTPVLVRKSKKAPSAFDGVVAREGVRILFQPTNTGDRYKSAAEERQLEKERSGKGKPPTATVKPKLPKGSKEGGVEVLVEKTKSGDIRVRARRCNMDYKTVVKEMSEEVIVKNLAKAVNAWVAARGVTGF